MIVRLTFKTPDVLHQAVDGIIAEHDPEDGDGAWQEEEDNPYLEEEIMAGLEEKLNKWIEFGEIITIEFDTENGTATVQERRT